MKGKKFTSDLLTRENTDYTKNFGDVYGFGNLAYCESNVSFLALFFAKSRKINIFELQFCVLSVYYLLITNKNKQHHLCQCLHRKLVWLMLFSYCVFQYLDQISNVRKINTKGITITHCTVLTPHLLLLVSEKNVMQALKIICSKRLLLFYFISNCV